MKSSHHDVFTEKYSVRDVLEMPGVQEIVEEHADRGVQRLGGLREDYEIEVTFEDHLVVVHFVAGRH